MPGESLYDILGISRSADTAEIKKAYRKLVMVHHPDKGGDHEMIQKINRAYEVLSDERKRELYDQTGMEDPEAEMGGGGGGGGGMPFPFPMDIPAFFGNMFGGGMPDLRRQRSYRGDKAPPKISEMNISLHDFFHGKSILVEIQRQQFCPSCKGDGAESYESCGGCNGSGFTQKVVMMGPGMQGVMRGPCVVCSGKGKKVGRICKSCNGSKFHLQTKTLPVIIEPGMKPGEKIIFSKESSDDPEYTEAGDVYIILQEADEPDSEFKREEDDLIVKVQITLKQALLGCKKSVHGHPAHPTGFEFGIPVGIQNGGMVLIPGEGMPRRGKGERGHLRVYVQVITTAEEKAALLREGVPEAIEKLFMHEGPSS
jgi:DnaJ-class molecular chaperone